MKYIEKIVQNEQGFDVPCWVATEGSFDILTGKARLKMAGWKDAQAFVDKRPSAGHIWVELELTSLQSFETVWGELAMRLISEGKFEGGVIADTPEDTATSGTTATGSTSGGTPISGTTTTASTSGGVE